MLSLADIAQMADIIRRVVFLLFLLCFQAAVQLFFCETCQLFRCFLFFYQNNTNSSPGLLGCRPFFRRLPCTILTLHIVHVFQSWSTLVMKNKLLDLSQSEMEKKIVNDHNHNRPFYRYGGHIELIRLKEYYRMPRGHEHISFVFSSAFRDIFS